MKSGVTDFRIGTAGFSGSAVGASTSTFHPGQRVVHAADHLRQLRRRQLIAGDVGGDNLRNQATKVFVRFTHCHLDPFPKPAKAVAKRSTSWRVQARCEHCLTIDPSLREHPAYHVLQDRRAGSSPTRSCTGRHLLEHIERYFKTSSSFRRIASRYDKLAASFTAMIKLACIRLRLRVMSPQPNPKYSGEPSRTLYLSYTTRKQTYAAGRSPRSAPSRRRRTNTATP